LYIHINRPFKKRQDFKLLKPFQSGKLAQQIGYGISWNRVIISWKRRGLDNL